MFVPVDMFLFRYCQCHCFVYTTLNFFEINLLLLQCQFCILLLEDFCVVCNLTCFSSLKVAVLDFCIHFRAVFVTMGIRLLSVCAGPEAVHGQDCPSPSGGQGLLMLKIFGKLFSKL